MAENPRTILIENLKIDIIIEYSNTDKSDPNYVITFSSREKQGLKWQTIYHFQRFIDLNKIVHTACSTLISSQFPKIHRKSSLGWKLNDKELDERRTSLILWLREVLANFDISPPEVRQNLLELIQVPTYYHVNLVSVSSIDAYDNSFKETGGATRSEIIDYMNLERQRTSASNTDIGGIEVAQRLTRVSAIALMIKALLDSCYQKLFLQTSKVVIDVVCISRYEKAITYESQSMLGILMHSLQQHSFFHYLFALIYFSLWSPITLNVLQGYAIPATIFIVTSIYYLVLLYQGQLRKWHAQTLLSYHKVGRLEQILRKFVYYPDLVYEEYAHPLPITPKTHVDDLFQAALEKVRQERRLSMSGTIMASVAAGLSGTKRMLRSSSLHGDDLELSASDPTAERITSLTTSDRTTTTTDEKAMQRRLFEAFECTDLSDEARAMYIDRRYTHNFTVRGPDYLTTKKKVHPGPAICKLMMVELYEVEAKSGDRHDHVASRGLARERVKAIAALPGSPFQFIINYQIPGDPPVSIVWFFALPPDVKDRADDPDLAKFLSILEKFSDIPKTEAERLATWGIHVAAEPTVLAKTDGKDDDSAGSSVDISDSEDEEHDQDSEYLPTSFGDPTDDPTIAEDAIKASEASKKTRTTTTTTTTTIVPPTSVSTSSGWKIPSDISWPDPYEPGALPQSDFRNSRFKLIPTVTEGPWIVKAAVPTKPAILGRKVVQRYFRGNGYVEVDIHVGSSVIATQIVSMCRGYSKNFAADVGIVIQGEDPSELPERMLGCGSFHKVNTDIRQKLD